VIALFLAAMLLFLGPFTSEKRPEPGMPRLHTIKTAILSPSYSCRSSEESQSGYTNSGLFLSPYSVKRFGPDLLFNGACGSKDYFHGSTAGDDMSIIADLGVEPLERISASRAFNLRRIDSFDLFSKFAQEVPVAINHTYALLIDKHEVRGLVLFTVTAYQANKSVEIRYAVKEYQLLNVAAESAGFDWEAGNQADVPE
jgi:hypothetical protein